MTEVPFDMDGTELYGAIRRMSCRYSYRMRDESEDLAHDVWLVVHRAKLKNPYAVFSYAKGTARLIFLNKMWRQADRRRKIWESSPPATSAPSHAQEDLELRQKVEIAVKRLCQLDQDIITKFYLNEEPREKIQSDLGLTSTQFRLRKCRALKRMRRIMTP